MHLLKYYGNGDPDKGMKEIKRRLDNKSKGARDIAAGANADDIAIQKKKEEFFKFLEDGRSKH